MTREEAVVHIKDVICENNAIKPNMVVFEQEKEALYMAIKVLEQEPCEDCISREAARDLMYHKQELLDEYDLDTLPSVTPQPKTGHWIEVYQGDEIINYRCSECELGDTNGSTNLYGWDYCRRCGARMVEPQESGVSNADSN